MTNKNRTILKIVIPLFIGLVLVWYSLSQISIGELIDYARGANPLYIALGILFGVLSHISRAQRWLYMAQPLGYKPRFANSFMAVYAAYLINFTVPRAGEIARASILANYEGIPFEKGFGTIIAERVADTLMLGVVIVLAMVFQYDFLKYFFSERIGWSSFIFILLIALVVLVGSIYLIGRSDHKLAKRIRTFLKGLLEGVLSIFRMKNKWRFIAHTLFIWIMYVLMFYITTLALPDLGFISMGALLLGFILASFSIAATNGGIGSYPEAVVIAFTLYQIPEDPSRAFGWIMWATHTIVTVLIGGASLFYLPLYNRKLKKV